jgi:hypothetical protein
MAIVTKEGYLGDEEYDQLEEKFRQHVAHAKRLRDELSVFIDSLRSA